MRSATGIEYQEDKANGICTGSEKPYVEFLVGYRFATEHDANLYQARIFVEAFPTGSLSKDDGDKVKLGKVHVEDHGLILIQNCKEPKKWGIICINSEYADIYRSIIARLDQVGIHKDEKKSEHNEKEYQLWSARHISPNPEEDFTRILITKTDVDPNAEFGVHCWKKISFDETVSKTDTGLSEDLLEETIEKFISGDMPDDLDLCYGYKGGKHSIYRVNY